MADSSVSNEVGRGGAASVARELLKSAKGSAWRSTTNAGTLDADPVLREFLRSYTRA
jgi:hypothetical protein